MKRDGRSLALAAAFAAAFAATGVAKPISCDVCVVGGGSAGFAAALVAAEKGCSTILVEKEPMLGGTSTIAGVNNWEPGCGGDGVPQRVYERLAAIPGACGIWRQTMHSSYGDAFPGALLEIDGALTYADTLRRHGKSMTEDRADWLARYHGIIFEPRQMDAVMRAMLSETGKCRVMLSTSFVSCRLQGGRIAELTLSNGKVIVPKVVVDACGFVAKDAGCETVSSPAPNGVTLVFRVSSRPEAPEIVVPADTPDAPWSGWGASFPQVWCGRYPNGDLMVNMLPTMSGDQARQLGAEQTYEECRRRVFAEWKWMKATYPQHFGDYKITEICSRAAYRDTHRVVCEYTLTGDDVRFGRHFDDEIATADHAFDSHGSSTAYSGELAQPYGIPLRSLKPLGIGNLYVAGRIAGFDTDAASSCRLSRTMMKLGEAAGNAAAADAKDATLPVEVAVGDDNEVTVTVAPGCVRGEESALSVAYGDKDYGASPAAWPEEMAVASSVGSEGGVFKAVLQNLDKYPEMKLRAFVGQSLTGLQTDQKAYIDLGVGPTLGRSYEITFGYNKWSEADLLFLFGGVGRIGGAAKTAFQIFSQNNYGAERDPNGMHWTAACTLEADQGQCDGLFNPVKGEAYAIRIDYAADEQRYYWKRVGEVAYALKGRTTPDLASHAHQGDLFLFARNDNGPVFVLTQNVTGYPSVDAFCTVYRYRETDLATGEAIRDLVPAVDGNGVWYFRDEASGGTEYRNASSVANSRFTAVNKIVRQDAYSSVVAVSGVSAAFDEGGRRVCVRVREGALTGQSGLILCWGPSDGGMSTDGWQHSMEIAEGAGAAGGSWDFSCARLGIRGGDLVRALLRKSIPVLGGVKTSSGARIDIAETAQFDRQYDIRFKGTGKENNVALFGGLSSDKSSIIQLWFENGLLSVWLGDATKVPLFTTENDVLYDVRLVMKNGEQKAYWKKATDDDYAEGASATVTALGTYNLGLLFRYNPDGGKSWDCSDYLSSFKITKISTGEVVRDIKPILDGENAVLYDFAAGKKLPGSFVFNTTQVGKIDGQPFLMSALEKRPLPVDGLLLLVK